MANVSTLVEQSEEKAAADEAEEESLIDQKLELVSQKEILAADIKQLQTETSRLERVEQISMLGSRRSSRPSWTGLLN